MSGSREINSAICCSGSRETVGLVRGRVIVLIVIVTCQVKSESGLALPLVVGDSSTVVEVSSTKVTKYPRMVLAAAG